MSSPIAFQTGRYTPTMTNYTLRHCTDPWPTNHEPHVDEAPHLLPGLTWLAELLLGSRARCEDVWQQAVCVSDLSPFGLSLAELRPLVMWGLVEASPAGSDSLRTLSAGKRSPARKGRGQSRSKARPENEWRRKFDGRQERSPAPSLSHHRNPSQLGPRSRLILTDAGLAYVTKHSSLCASLSPTQGLSHARILPHYEVDARELHVVGVAILCLPVQARNLATVLTALQHSGWSRRVAKPLHASRGGNDHHHLANVALRLNRNQQMIDFRTDDGAIRWTWRTRSGVFGSGSDAG